MLTAVYGGSFDPPHAGHLRAASLAVKEPGADRIFIIPAAVSPFKKRRRGQPTDAGRLELCRLAFSGIPGAEVRDDEMRRGGTSYTVDTLEALKNEYPDDTFFLVIGSDQLISFRKWHEWRRILSISPLFAVLRDAGDLEAALAEARAIEDETGSRVTLYTEDPLVVSSTCVRDGTADAGLPEAAEEYIKKHRLYPKRRAKK